MTPTSDIRAVAMTAPPPVAQLDHPGREIGHAQGMWSNGGLISRFANTLWRATDEQVGHRLSTISVRLRRHHVMRDRRGTDAIASLSAMSMTKTSDFIGLPPKGRKLVAVVYADMVGYSHLIALDDVGTIERLRALRRIVIDPAIDEHGGRIVQTGGDSLPITCDSIVRAVCCAMKVQQRVPIHNEGQPSDGTIRFRIGITIGDAIADGSDPHGDVVNVAARLQAERPPGARTISID
jgi:class 3 adenylate cyclase